MTILKKYIVPAFKFIAAGAFILHFACSEPDFTVKGEIYGAENNSIVLEKSDFQGYWVAVDSTRISNKGMFSMKRPAPAYSEIFRLRLGSKFIYFPVQNKETIKVATSVDKFGTDYTVSGSDEAEAMAGFDRELSSLPSNVSADSLSSFKKRVYTTYMQPVQGSIVAYYILTKPFGDSALFNPEKGEDAKYFAAVATGFKEVRPQDPRTRLLEQTSLQAMKRRNTEMGNIRQIEANEISIVDIELPDVSGNNKKLSDVAGHGKPVVVIFSPLVHPEAPGFNMELSKIYNSKSGGVEFYQVSEDADQFEWREAARNLPWIAVYEADPVHSKAIANYNVSNMPVFFIYNAAGELTQRVNTLQELKKALSGM